MDSPLDPRPSWLLTFVSLLLFCGSFFVCVYLFGMFNTAMLFILIVVGLIGNALDRGQDELAERQRRRRMQEKYKQFSPRD